MCKTFCEWFYKIEETKDISKLHLMALKVIVIGCNTLLTTLVKLMETVKEHLFRNRSKRRCHTRLDFQYVSKAQAFQDFLVVGERKKVCRRQRLVDVEEQSSIH
ncbi:hypothetical protein AVEN_234219-1 [Araneus ventricosus]|uniref:Uncharacterized protein n=1 Tax=Araneus ventricosus TaxID=182803 RepID=A0A4Y2A7Q4_ARAVE|nr:hypothetical protein AVEN_234219-1 [Araneus ventricosus]